MRSLVVVQAYALHGRLTSEANTISSAPKILDAVCFVHLGFDYLRIYCSLFVLNTLL